RDVVLYLADRAPAARAEGVARFAEARHEGARYLMLRYRPQLEGAAQWQRHHWVFLCETSGDRDPLLARVQIDVIRNLLRHAEPEDTFTVAAAGTRCRFFSDNPLPVTEKNVAAAVAFLEGSQLIGALDL